MKYYVIRQGKKKWTFTSRDECKDYVQGFRDAKYKSFKTKQEAEAAFKDGYELHYESKPKDRWRVEDLPYEKNSIAVDAACSWNPGQLEYKWIDLPSGKILFHQKFSLWTNNIGEFLAIVHGLKYLKEHKHAPWLAPGSDKALYSDSKHAISRISQKKCKTKLEKTTQTKKMFEIIAKAEVRLQKNKYTTKMLKRHTSEWWEIPADFGRK